MNCSGCGVGLAPEQVLYTPRGDVACATCVTRNEIRDHETQSKLNAKNAVGGLFCFWVAFRILRLLLAD